ncbi:hypothetical protein F3Y22_tig00112383pilonHSYRG00567 [Hibiscus syriacus]|uniref:Uncharacterized protein n=1 Tax=Hibiscus syriacus TaxID=106335 RepID=A0A6A2XKY8_HIBSY|nr:hypothetical protein F3Y22_tig00112383pilonHSYRG00567 [Hibiscus syriacus]
MASDQSKRGSLVSHRTMVVTHHRVATWRGSWIFWSVLAKHWQHLPEAAGWWLQGKRRRGPRVLIP